jgi:hypothetical protein
LAAVTGIGQGPAEGHSGARPRPCRRSGDCGRHQSQERRQGEIA